MYHVGDKVVHPGHGGCVIDEIGPKSWKGETNDFYTLLPLTEQNLRLLVPVSTARDLGLRDVISAEQAEQILSDLQEMETNWIDDRKERQHTYEEILRSDDLWEISRTVKTLLARKVHKALSTSDKHLLEKGKGKLLSELALSLSCSFDEMERTVTETSGTVDPALAAQGE